MVCIAEYLPNRDPENGGEEKQTKGKSTNETGIEFAMQVAMIVISVGSSRKGGRG